MKFRFLRILYNKLVKINDTPQRVALGFGWGVFLGIFPGAGPIASLFLAMLFRLNRASALIGCLLTNTWISFVTFILAIKAGAVVSGVHWQDIAIDWNAFIKTFNWRIFFQLSVLKMLLPILIGYILIGLFFGLLAYIISLLVILKGKRGGLHAQV